MSPFAVLINIASSGARAVAVPHAGICIRPVAMPQAEITDHVEEWRSQELVMLLCCTLASVHAQLHTAGGKLTRVGDWKCHANGKVELVAG